MSLPSVEEEHFFLGWRSVENRFSDDPEKLWDKEEGRRHLQQVKRGWDLEIRPWVCKVITCFPWWWRKTCTQAGELSGHIHCPGEGSSPGFLELSAILRCRSRAGRELTSESSDSRWRSSSYRVLYSWGCQKYLYLTGIPSAWFTSLKQYSFFLLLPQFWWRRIYL